jgi:GPH family glycoside/pentoside/hexuronide:cation symporter
MTLLGEGQIQSAGAIPIARYATSHFGKTILWATTEVYGVFSLTDLIGLSPVTAAATFVLLLVWSALCDLAVGYGLDWFRNGRLPTALMRLAGLVSAIVFAFSFVPMDAGSTSAALALFATFLFRLCFSFADVPHNTLLRELADSPRAQLRLSAVRMLAGAAAYFSLSGIAILILAGQSGDIERFRTFTSVLGLIGAALFLTAPALRSRPAEVGARSTAGAGARQLFRGAVIRLLGATMIGIVGFSLALKTLPYVARYAVGDEAWLGSALFAVTLGKLLTTPVWWWLAHRRGARRANVLAYFLVPLAAALMAFSVGDGTVRIIGLGLLGAAIGGASMQSWALIAAAVEDGERLGQRIQATLFGAFTCASKLAVGLGGAVIAITSVTIRSEATADQGILLVSLIVAATGVIGALLLWSAPTYTSEVVRPGRSASTTNRARV